MLWDSGNAKAKCKLSLAQKGGIVHGVDRFIGQTYESEGPCHILDDVCRWRRYQSVKAIMCLFPF